MEVRMGMTLWMKGTILLVCLAGCISSTPIRKEIQSSWKEVISQLHVLNKKPITCSRTMVWQVNFGKEQMCAAMEVLNNVTNCHEIEPLKRNMKVLLGNSTSNETCLEVQDTKVQMSRFLKDLLNFCKKAYNENNQTNTGNPN